MMSDNSTLSLQELTFSNGKPDHFQYRAEENQFHGVDPFLSDVRSYQMLDSPDNTLFTKYHQEQSFPHDLLDDLQYNPMEEVSNNRNENEGLFTFSSLQLLQNYDARSKRLIGENKIDDRTKNTTTSQNLSTDDVLKLAGSKFIQSSSSSEFGDLSCVASHPFGLYFSGLSAAETTDIELAELLLLAAEKANDQQYDRARRLLNQCDRSSSRTGNPVQRLVHCFAEAVRDKIDRETGIPIPIHLGKRQARDIEEALMAPTATMVACHEETPFAQAFQFPAVQAAAESVAAARRVHVVDLAIRNGVQWIVFMQALAARGEEWPVERLTVTAVGTTRRRVIEETGTRLKGFAESVKLGFCFKVVMVAEMVDLKQDMFEVGEDEVVVVYAQRVLRTMLSQPTQLDHLMTILKTLNPRIMIIHEVDSNHNSPVFADRFIEALFFFGAYFDCLEACMARNSPSRAATESFLRSGIRNIVAMEGEERSVRSVKIGVWRAFLGRFGMEEAELSSSAVYQARLVVEQFGCGRSCTLDADGKSLIIGWKGTPIHSLSVWKFR